MSIFTDYVKSQAEAKKMTPQAWLQGTVDHIASCTLATHVGKFTHPSSKNVDIQDMTTPLDRTYVVTSQVSCSVDIVVNAAYIGTGRLLLKELEDTKPVLLHIQEKDVQLKTEIEQFGVSYQPVYEAVAAISQPYIPQQTNGYIKQVYFPVSDKDYHLLSVLPSSSVMAEVKKRIEIEHIREKECCNEKSTHYGETYRIWPHLTEIHFGGTKPQNISVLNAMYRGTFLALPSLPPIIQQRTVRIPKKDVFQETLPYTAYKPLLLALHDILKNNQNNMQIREKRENIVYHIIQIAWAYCYMVREEPAGWSQQEAYAQLPQAQKIWLDEAYAVQRKNDMTWRHELQAQFGRWFIKKYRDIVGKDKKNLGDTELAYIKKLMKHTIQKDVREQ